MTTTTTAIFFNTLDNMVVDYINRKDEIGRNKLLTQVHEESEFCSKRNLETPTLESVLLSYTRQHGFNFDSSNTPEDNVQPPQDTVSNGVYFPLDTLPEVANRVLSCTPLKTVYTMRLLSRNWNLVTSEYLRSKKERTLEFTCEKKVSRFILAFSNSMETPLPFSSFNIKTYAVDSLSVLERIGTQLRTGTLTFGPATTANSLILVQCFKLTPFLTRLTVRFGENGLQKANSSQCKVTLRNLRFIEVCQSTTLQWTALEPLLRYCPSLESLRVVHCKLLTDSDLEFASFVDYVGSLRSARFEEVLSPMVDHVSLLSPIVDSKLHSLTLHVARESTVAMSYMLGRLSQSLEHLVLSQMVFLLVGLTIPKSLPKLRTLSLFLNQENGFTTRLLPEVIPAVTNLTIFCRNPSSCAYLFQGVYNTVTTLNLHEPEVGEVMHGSFRQVTTLRLSGRILHSHIDWICDNFPRLSLLHLGFGPYHKADTIFKLREVDGKMHWNLIQLKELKQLIVQVPQHTVERLLAEIFELCLNQNMPVLDSLTVVMVETESFWVKQTQNRSKAAELKRAVRRLSALQYHKQFRYEKRYRYLFEDWVI